MAFFQRPSRSFHRRPRLYDQTPLVFGVGDEVYVTCGAFKGLRTIAAVGFDYYAIHRNGRQVFVNKAVCEHPSQEPSRVRQRQWEQDREDRKAHELEELAEKLATRPLPFGCKLQAG